MFGVPSFKDGIFLSDRKCLLGLLVGLAVSKTFSFFCQYKLRVVRKARACLKKSAAPPAAEAELIRSYCADVAGSDVIKSRA